MELRKEEETDEESAAQFPSIVKVETTVILSISGDGETIFSNRLFKHVVSWPSFQSKASICICRF